MPKEKDKNAKVTKIEEKLQELEKYKKGIEMMLNAGARNHFFSPAAMDEAKKTLVEVDGAIQYCKNRLERVTCVEV